MPAPLRPAIRAAASAAVAVALDGVAVTRHGRAVLRDVSLAVAPGELVAVVGRSGAGKSTLLEAMAGIRPVSSGQVSTPGRSPTGAGVGYVPQDDIVHRQLPVAETLRYAARLRLPPGTAVRDVDRAVARVLATLELADRASVPVGVLSGGQRKRVSIASELLASPGVLFLDEPTSGLDPRTAAALMDALRRVADGGAAVVLTTHSPSDLDRCDRVVTVDDGRVTDGGTRAAGAFGPVDPVLPAAGRPRAIAQLRTLAARDLAVLRADRLTLAITLAAPALVIAMFTMLFRRGAFSAAEPDASALVGTAYWIAFAAFFFGLTFGLLQICTEHAIVRREQFVGVRPSAYVLAKFAALLPVVTVVDVAMVVVLRWMDRLPPLALGASARLVGALVVLSAAALGLGLLASAVVAEPAQATLALPMLCFPAVLFAGGVRPVPTMSPGGRATSLVVHCRWGFEAVGRVLGLTPRIGGGGSPAGRALLAQYGGTFEGGAGAPCVVLVAFTAVALIAAVASVRARASRS